MTRDPIKLHQSNLRAAVKRRQVARTTAALQALRHSIDALKDGVGSAHCVCKSSYGHKCWPCVARAAIAEGRTALDAYKPKREAA